MQLVCIGLLLFSVTWSAPTFQPQTVKTSQDCVEEQKQRKKSNKTIAFDLLEEERHQEVTPKENMTPKKKSDLSLFVVNENNQNSKPSNLSAKTKTTNDGTRISRKGNAHDDLVMARIPEFTVDKRTEDGAGTISHLHVQEEYGATLTTNSRGPGTVSALWGEGSKATTPSNVLSKILAGVNYVKVHSEGKKNHQRGPQDHKSSVQSKSNHYTRRDTHYLTRLSKSQNVPSDFEGSGDTNQETEAHGLSPFSGDGQPFKDFCWEGGVTGPDVQTELAGQGASQAINRAPGVPGSNELPETEGHDGRVIGASSDRVRETGTGVDLGEGTNDIIGNTNFRELPGKEGNRVDADSQNAQQGKVESHYPKSPSREKGKEGGRDTSESTHYNEFPTHGKGSSYKGPEQSNRNEVTLSEKPIIPSRGLDNEIRHEIDSHNVPSNEGNIVTHRRQTHGGQHNSTRNKGRSHRKGPWSYRRLHSHRRASPSHRDHSTESSDSGSSSESADE
ncbi:matrix extracellular phosphoglycoprotein [Perognathus longimembris pacificus]|uniref:matrix extracellular phosphoglycoprotein n=1 Tax=Perognathus longimembris pacificus TaxID=214514 RepID=UPI002019D52E|nr:matrix extracellular phosphoglycoprotein [Perognathus longimembris pacificus]